jgi:hypothetical protein
MQPIGNPRSLTATEPGPPLRAVLDVPLRFAIPAELSAEVQTLSRTVRQTGPDGDWPAVYATAIQIAEALLEDVDGRLEEMQRRALTTEDPNEVRQRLSQGPRREAERGRTEAKAAVQKTAKEWVERSKRQLEHVSTQCLETAPKALPVKEEPTDAGILLRVDPPGYVQFTSYVGRCCEEWTKNVTGGAESAIAAGVSSATAPVVDKRKAAAVGAPSTLAAPSADLRLAAEPPSKEADVPSTVSALMQSVRSNIMAVGIFGTVIAVAVAMIGKVSGEEGGGRSPNTMLMRGGLVLAILPFSIFFGLRAAKKQRAILRDNAIAAHNQATQAFVKTEVDKALERHRKQLERWLTTRAEEWATAIDRWWDEAVESRLVEADGAGIEAMREAKLQQAKMTEEQTALRTFRNQLGQNLLFDLRKRQRELSDAAAPRS